MNSRIFLFLIMAAAIGGLFFLYHPGSGELPMHETQASHVQTSDGPALHSYLIGINKGQRVSGPGIIRVREGSQVALKFTTTEAVEIHLHGYDIKLNIDAGNEGSMVFSADQSGRFEFELHGKGHHGHASLGVVEVYPQ